VNEQNTKQKQKIEKMRGKKISLKSSHENIVEEGRYKDFQIKKLEEELANITKEYLEINNKLMTSQTDLNRTEKNDEMYSRKNTVTPNYALISTELKTIQEDKQNLQRENNYLSKTLESLQNEIKYKYVSKYETEKKLAQLESERNTYLSKLKISEINLDKLRREVQNFKVENDELRVDLERSEKKLEEFQSINKYNYYDMDGGVKETPLNFLLGEEEEGEVELQNPKMTFSKLRRFSNEVTEFKIKDEKLIFPSEYNNNMSDTPRSRKSISGGLSKRLISNHIIHEVENEHKVSNNPSFDNGNAVGNDNNNYVNNYIDTFQNKDDYLNISTSTVGRESIKFKPEIKMTSNEIVNRMSQNDFLTFRHNKTGDKNDKNDNNAPLSPDLLDEKSNSPVLEKSPTHRFNIKNINININQSHTLTNEKNRISLRQSLLKAGSTEEIYKDFFLLTFQALKLNSDSIEPFLYVNIIEYNFLVKS
jgi:hypothetical protein